MSNQYRGEVEFTDSNGKSYVLRLSINDYVKNKTKIDELVGQAWIYFMFVLALKNGAESQKTLTDEEAGEVLDDIGYVKGEDLILLTKYGKGSKEMLDEGRRRRAEAELSAAKTLGAKIAAIRKGVTNREVLAAVDQVLAKVQEMEAAAKAVEGNGNPPIAETASIN